MNSVDKEELNDFLDNVSETVRLVDGLKKGTLSTDYIDKKI